MADHSLANTSCTTDSSQATGLETSFVSLPGFANKTLSSETSATAMSRFSLGLRDLEARALCVVPETQWPSTEAIMHELSTDLEVTFRRVLGSAEVLPTRPGVDPLEVTRPLPDFSWTTHVIARPGTQPPAASHVFGPLTIQVDPETLHRTSSQTYNSSILYGYSHLPWANIWASLGVPAPLPEVA